MDAFILAAGRGTRLGVAAGGRPKPLVDIAGRPLLSHLTERLFDLGVKRIYLNSHHLAEQIESFKVDSPRSDQITVLHEEELLGTAGTIRNFLKDRPQDELLIMHGDNFFEDSLQNLLLAFRNRRTGLMGVAGTFLSPHPESCGIFVIDEEFVIQKLYEKQKPSFGNLANTAIYIFDSEALVEISKLPQELNDLSKHVLPRFLGKLLAVPLEGNFIDIGSPENLQKARSIATLNQSKFFPNYHPGETD